MAARVRLLCGPTGSGKTEQLLDLFRQRTRSQPGSALWLGPTHRAIDSIRSQLLRDSSSLVGPRLYAFAEFFDELIRCNDPSLRPLSAVQQRLLLEETASRLAARGRLSYFRNVLDTRGFQEGLLGLLGELKRQQISPVALARSLVRRREPTPLGGGVRDKDRQCARLFAHYERELHRQKLLDFDGRPARALELLRSGAGRPFQSVCTILVDGFVDFTSAQLQTLQLLANRVEEIWIALLDEPDTPRPELFSRSRSTRELLQARLTAEVEWLAEKSDTRPAGLIHLQRQLFLPLPAQQTTGSAEGVSCIEAPGPVGEARMVARRIKCLLLKGTPAEQVLVTLRDLGPSADLLQEVFEEYGLPLELEGIEPLTHNPAVAFLLRAVRLPDDDWPFAAVTALLRNTYFQPSWPEMEGCPEMPQHAEALLRLLGEPRGRDAYLTAIARWSEQPQPGLEDEQAEQSRRRRTHELAQRCQPFLARFFHAWDSAPAHAALEEHVAWLRSLADNLGLCRSAEDLERDQSALACLWQELDRWQQRAAKVRLERRIFLRRLSAIAGAAGLPRTPRGPGRVRVLSAELARHLEVDHLFVMGLGERSFPRLAGPANLLDERDRLAYQQAGLDLPGSADATPEEMLLFYQLITRARSSLTVSYPAVDERGQDLLPSSFLLALLDCFPPGTVATERRRMLIEGYIQDRLLSPVEYRVCLTARGPDALSQDVVLPEPLRANLLDAVCLKQNRFREQQHNAFDGLLRDPAIVQELAQRFGPERILSPTSLEEYVTCPFRFFLGSVLGLEPLEEPHEEIEVTRRGQACHRALARLHRQLQQEAIHQPDDSLADRVRTEIQRAVKEDMGRAPSAAARELWRLEGQRLTRRIERYGEHWQKFLTPWLEKGLGPRPHYFEIDFGLPAEGIPATVPHGPLVLREGPLEVRISGRIDRVDLINLADGSIGFWIIDYKTGRAGSYTSKGLTEFRRLQLTLYALAVEEVLLADQNARPLGLAYWLVMEDGPKLVLPATRDPLLWLTEERRWKVLRDQLRTWVLTLVNKIRQGEFPLQPRDEDCPLTCHFGQTCRITQSRKVEKEWSLPLPIIAMT